MTSFLGHQYIDKGFTMTINYLSEPSQIGEVRFDGRSKHFFYRDADKWVRVMTSDIVDTENKFKEMDNAQKV